MRSFPNRLFAAAVLGGVAAPVAASELGPVDCGDRVQAEELANDRGWELAGQGEQGTVAVGSGVDANGGDAAGEADGVQVLSGPAAGEQPLVLASSSASSVAMAAAGRAPRTVAARGGREVRRG